MVEGVEAVADRDGEQVGAVVVVEHVRVGVDHCVARERQADDGGRQHVAEVAVVQRLFDELDRGRLAALQADDRSYVVLSRELRHGLRVVEVATEWPLAIHGLAGGERSGDQFSMLGHLDRHRDDVDVRLGHESFMIREHGAHAERLACRAGRFRARCAQCPDLVIG